MEHALSILMIALSAGLFLYAGLIALDKTMALVPKSHAVGPKDKKAYARQFAKVLAVCALAPAAAGLVGLLAGNAVLFITLIAGFIICIWIGTRLMKQVQ